MCSQLEKPFSTLLALLLALSSLTVSGVLTVAGDPAPAAQQNIPDDLMSAILAASAPPLGVGGEGYRARSGGLDFTFRGDGFQAAGHGFAWDLTLKGLGRGEQIAPVTAPEIVQTDGRLEYRRGLLTEWYRNTVLGVEQGFTLHQAPRGRGPLVLRLSLSTDLAGTPDDDGSGLSFAAPGGQTLRYGCLRAWDASGSPLQTHLRYLSGQVTLEVDDQGAAYPITVDPLIYLEQKVLASGAAGDYFGGSVAVSGDTALLGAYGVDLGADEDQGSAYVFIRTGTTWTLQQRLLASDGAAGDFFGNCVTLSGDTALVAAAGDDFGANADQGSVYVFVRSGATWTQQAHFFASDGGAGDYFGDSVALSGDTALVGAQTDDVGANQDQGSAYVFVRTGTTWSEQAHLFASDGAADDQFGYPVALSGDGDTALVGASEDDVGANASQGSAYVFVRGGTAWTQQAHLFAPDGAAEDWFGISVALSGDTALVGAEHDQVGANALQGSVYVFVRSGQTWTLQAHLTASDGAAGDYFGYFVALAGDTALVGAPRDDIGSSEDQGSTYVFVRSGTVWTQQSQLTASDGAANDWFGSSAALSGDGDTALIGAPPDLVGGNYDQGSAYVFVRSGSFWGEQAQLAGSDGEPSDNFGYSVALSGNTALVGADLDNVGANTWQGSAYVFTRGGVGWSLQQKLTGSDGGSNDYFGRAVALAGDTALVAAPGHTVGANPGQGSVYVFVRSGTSWSQQAELTAPDGAPYDSFGSSVALSGDTALVGAMADQVGVSDEQGSAYVFIRSGTTWTQQAHLTASDGAARDWFGYSVALVGDTALVGAMLDDEMFKINQGSAYVFARKVATWTQQARLTASDSAAEDYFGSSVALSGDGRLALVGARLDDVGANGDQGSAYVYALRSMGWREQAHLIASDGGAEDHFGGSVALAGETALVGASDDDVGANAVQGSAYVFTQSGTLWTQQAQLIASDGAQLDHYGFSVALAGDGNTLLVGSPWDEIGDNYAQGSAYFYTLVNWVWLPLLLRNAP